MEDGGDDAVVDKVQLDLHDNSPGFGIICV